MIFQRIAVLGLALIGAVTAQPAGVYVRPSGDQVTGNPNWWVPNHRSPCPAMNSLANHGYINRNGKDITPGMLKKAMKSVFNVDDSVANFIVQGLANKFTLADLSKHNFIEHDASLVHADVFYKLDPAQVDGGLANDLLARGDSNRMLGKDQVAEALRVRLIWCQQKQGGCDFKSNQRDVTFREAAKLLLIFGGKRNNQRISIDDTYSFLVLEKFPDNWKKSQQSISLNELENLSKEMQRKVRVA